MRTIIKTCFFVMASALLLVSVHAGAADSTKDNKKSDDPVRKCQLECKKHKTNESYEGCMLDCKKLAENKSPVTPAPNK